ncbi:MAG TPA: hypothetical protein VEB20_23635 [Azospirillaceae bacterium]|nr:hypothetical protein [Azospirillaceae bacterium]
MPSTSDITKAPVSTGQAAAGRPIFRSVHGLYQLMLWTGTGSSNAIWFGTCKTGSYAPAGAATKADSAAGFGPAFALAPAGDSGYLAWVADNKRIMVAKAVADGSSPPKWSIPGTPVAIPSSNAASAPVAALREQNGALVLTLVWQDAGAGGMVYCQLDSANLAASTAFAGLGQSCKGSPWLAAHGAATFLAYTGTDGQFNLAVDPDGGVAFDFANRFTAAGITSDHGPAYVPLSRSQGYVCWASAAGLSYQQIGIDSDGDWALNTRAGCSGTIAGINPTAAPSAQLTTVTDDQGVTSRVIVVAAPSAAPPAAKANTVMVAGFVPDTSSVPLPLAQLATS